MSNGRFLKLSGGWIHVDIVRWAEIHDDGAMVLALDGRDQPIVLKGEDRRTVETYLDSMLWEPLSTRTEADDYDDPV